MFISFNFSFAFAIDFKKSSRIYNTSISLAVRPVISAMSLGRQEKDMLLGVSLGHDVKSVIKVFSVGGVFSYS